ncbi:hypothetical protein [uncultured Campylobacter sp.]|uniref:hypothetical protein n=1 Tax=uncultured Campylobacter sp. TaxID=218934 RepID=UPI00261DEE0C|nr:hypothetical protein [uncultured Campylobacter sp.]
MIAKTSRKKNLNIKISKLALRGRVLRRNRQNLKPCPHAPPLNLKGEILRSNSASIKFQGAIATSNLAASRTNKANAHAKSVSISRS